jgi:hypothetical protein
LHSLGFFSQQKKSRAAEKDAIEAPFAKKESGGTKPLLQLMIDYHGGKGTSVP